MEKIKNHEFKGHSSSSLEGLPPYTEILPLSYSQRLFWVMSQLGKDKTSLILPLAIHFEGSLDVDVLKDAICELIARHESLRAIIRIIKGRPNQIILKDVDFPFEIIDLESLSYIDREDRLYSMISEEAQSFFDFQEALPWRAKLIRLQKDSHILLLTFHHIICDGYSTSIIFTELAHFYEAFKYGKRIPTDTHAIDLRDFITYEAKRTHDLLNKGELKYWENEFVGGNFTINLPTDYPRPALPSQAGAWRSLVLDKTIVEKIIAFGHQQYLTPFMIIAAALCLLLYKWAHQNDIVIGTVTSNRGGRGLNKLVGNLMNFLPIRVRLDDNWKVLDFLQIMRSNIVCVFSRQDHPFEKILETLRQSHIIGYQNFYNVSLMMQSFTPFLKEARFLDRDLQLHIDAPHCCIKYTDDLLGTVILTRTQNHSAALDLRFEAYTYPNRIYFGCEYNTDIFESNTVNNLLRDFGLILSKMIDDADYTIRELI